jgi:photosystem II stability/assembly factor-like uncharacterized protein
MIPRYLCLVFAATASLWSAQATGVDSNLRGISIVVPGAKDKTTAIWAGGSNGVIVRSTDSGKNWERLHIPNSDSLDFRGVQAFDSGVAYVMASGQGEKSGIFKTSDGGKIWTKQYSDPRKEFFLDGIACLNSMECFALSDPIDGKFLIVHTVDGTNWKEIVPETIPAALPKEGAFAASNTCLIADGKHDLYFGTGGPAARVFHSGDGGRNWTVAETPVIHGNAPQGIFSLTRRGDELVAVGGDYQSPQQTEGIAAYSLDKGKSWRLVTEGPKGYRSAVVASGSEFIAVGPTGVDISKDGIVWRPGDSVSLNAIVSVNGETWGVGSKGSVLKLSQFP